MSLQTRDCFSIVRSIVETVVNILFIMAGGRDAAQRADRHAQQKAYRDLKRQSSAGDWTVVISSNVELAPEDEAMLEKIVKEFSTKKGHEKRYWTDESLTDRIHIASQKFPKSSVLLLHMASFNVYRHSSEILHGTYFASMHFWGLTTIGRKPPGNSADLRRTLSEHQFSVLMSAIFAFTALLECLSVYVGAADIGEQAGLELQKLHELPLIKQALEASGDEGTPFQASVIRTGS